MSIPVGIGDWGLGNGELGVGGWVLRPIHQSPFPNPQSPIPTSLKIIYMKNIKFKIYY